MNRSKGFSLIELLATILILSLVSGGIVTGVMLSNKQYKSSIRQSEASELYNTISSLLNYELKLTNEVKLDADKLVAFKSISYQIDESSLCNIYVLYESGYPVGDSYGRIAFGNNDKKNYLLGNAAYTNGLGAKLIITYDNTNKMFTVDLDIGYDTKSVVHQIFNVRALNRVHVNAE